MDELKTAPPVELAYHRTDPVLAVADSVMLPVPHLLAGVVLAMVGLVLTVTLFVVAEQPVEPLVYVKLAVPAATPVTTPVVA